MHFLDMCKVDPKKAATSSALIPLLNFFFVALPAFVGLCAAVVADNFTRPILVVN